MFHLFNQVKRFKVNIICSIKTVMGGACYIMTKLASIRSISLAITINCGFFFS